MIGNEDACDECRAGRCGDCIARDDPDAWCEHACRWLYRLVPIPR